MQPGGTSDGIDHVGATPAGTLSPARLAARLLSLMTEGRPRVSRRVLAGPSLALGYVLSGRLGLLLAVPPGYATAIFPPAGIAVTAMLMGGAATLPWTFLGSFLLNLWVGSRVGQGISQAGLAALVIAAASTLQAGVGGFALSRAVGYPARLDNGRDLARFLFLTPLYCLISATLSVSGLAALGVLASRGLWVSWVTWWIGDTLGVLVVLPLMLVFAGEPRSLWRGRARSVALPMLSFFAVFVAIFALVREWGYDQSLLEFRVLSQGIAEKLRVALEKQEFLLEELRRSSSAPLSAADFHRLAQDLPRRFPLAEAIEWAPRITREERARFEAAEEARLPGFEIREIGPSGRLKRAAERPRYYPVTDVEPLSGNAKVLGFDPASTRNRRAAIEKSKASRRAAATAPIRLFAENGTKTGMLLVESVGGGPGGPGALRQAQSPPRTRSGDGVLAVPLRTGAFMKKLLAPERSMIRARLVDMGSGKALWGDPSRGSSGPFWESEIDFAGRRLRLRTEPTSAYLSEHGKWQSWAVLVAGVLSTGLLGALLMLGTGYARRIETVVEERTRDLEGANVRLQQEIRERLEAEARLRQAQRMEAIGQLTGGIAHDFNNLLMVMSGNATLLANAAADDRARRWASAILTASERGERLTRQLLAFSRRQTLHPEAVDLRQRMREIGELLSRSLREDIALGIEMPEDLWPITVDPAEFELALLNIGVNARDAMPSGGSFRLVAQNASFEPDDPEGEGLVGDFVVVSLSDSGAGMEPEVLARAFEPYFTTKAEERGSGLGLSQVYGFTRQSGGIATIASAPGRGTCVRLLLPRASAIPPAAAVTPARWPPEALFPAGPSPKAERVLLVEDDPEVAAVTAELLRDIGFAAVTQSDARSALARLDSDPTIALVLSDIVMPGGASGIDLARALRQRRPGLPIVLLTGHSRDAPELVAEGFALLEKPYRRERLHAVISAALERAETGAEVSVEPEA